MLRKLGLNAIPLHGKMSQVLIACVLTACVFINLIKVKRLGALGKFKNKSRSILIATDVASRGLDIPHVDVVINFDIPTHSKVHVWVCSHV